MTQFTMEWANSQNAKRFKKHAPETDAQIPDAKQRQRAQPLACNSSGKAQGTECPLVRFTLRRVKLLDVDAKYGSVKDLLDGCTIAGLIRGDQEGQIRLEVEQEKVGHYEQEETVIEIEVI